MFKDIKLTKEGHSSQPETDSISHLEEMANKEILPDLGEVTMSSLGDFVEAGADYERAIETLQGRLSEVSPDESSRFFDDLHAINDLSDPKFEELMNNMGITHFTVLPEGDLMDRSKNQLRQDPDEEELMRIDREFIEYLAQDLRIKSFDQRSQSSE